MASRYTQQLIAKLAAERRAKRRPYYGKRGGAGPSPCEDDRVVYVQHHMGARCIPIAGGSADLSFRNEFKAYDAHDYLTSKGLTCSDVFEARGFATFTVTLY